MHATIDLRRCVLLLTFSGVLTFAAAQSPVTIMPPASYYIDVNQVDKPDVYKLYDGIMGIQYNDRYGVTKDFLLTIYNWKYEPAAKFSLDKAPGLNQYTLDLGESLKHVEKDRTYFCSFTDEAGNNYEWMVMFTDKPKTDLGANIIVNPKELSCKDLEENMVEFYGEIVNGRAPYSVSWYVLNSEKTDFLYQPREEHVQEQGKTSMIQVDRAPAYNVMLEVTDACGNNVKKMVYLTCSDRKKKINTVFVEPVQRINSNPLKGTN